MRTAEEAKDAWCVVAKEWADRVRGEGLTAETNVVLRWLREAAEELWPMPQAEKKR